MGLRTLPQQQRNMRLSMAAPTRPACISSLGEKQKFARSPTGSAFLIATRQGSALTSIPQVSRLRRPAALSAAISKAWRRRLRDLLARSPLGHLTVPVLAAFTIANIAAGCSLIALFVAIGRRRHG